MELQWQYVNVFLATNPKHIEVHVGKGKAQLYRARQALRAPGC
jgi:hypothetical protein